MLKYLSIKKILLVAACALTSQLALAVDIVKWPDTGNMDTPQEKYKFAITTTALQKTIPDYGVYKIEKISVETMSTQRAREMLRLGDSFNIYTALTTPDWEADTIPIRIPIRRGLLNYRLLLVHKDNINMFSQINSAEALKKIKVGSQLGWATTGILETEGFNVVRGKKLDGMFYMLDGNRFDYLPRGINEIFNDLDKYRTTLAITLEPHLALNIPAPTYIFIAPEEKRLARRITDGLEIMISDGTLKSMFYEAYGEYLQQADLKNRKIITVKNSSLSPQTPLERPELWYDTNETPQ
jgi:hypothetical protein